MNISLTTNTWGVNNIILITGSRIIMGKSAGVLNVYMGKHSLWIKVIWIVRRVNSTLHSWHRFHVIPNGSNPFCIIPASVLYFVSPRERPWRHRVLRRKTLVIARATGVFSHAFKKEHRDWRIIKGACAGYILGRTQWRHGRSQDETKYRYYWTRWNAQETEDSDLGCNWGKSYNHSCSIMFPM